ncbi:MAG: hypothetical protein QOC78_1416 [Solirubrobacteraceae bacterium]|jgi:uncharacterized Ntn-hydrolase superfamily protein|nr:hypothetical protein [Solirubrobacteraceae bacterium]
MLRTGTYSIVARDPRTGELGVAVQSHWFAVGPIVPWVRPGVGAVATQSIAEPAYGPRGLERMAAGEDPRSALDALLAADDRSRLRQVALVDARGAVAVHTGAGCIAHAGHAQGEQFSAQANMMASPEVWPAMAAAFEASEGHLSRRLLAALQAAEAQGGDARGRQSAALVVAPPEGDRWRRAIDVRVDDHPEPLAELGRLLDLAEAYALASEGDELVGEGRHDEAGALYRRASSLAPDNHELLFWSGLAAVQAGELATGMQNVREAIRLQPGWRDILARLGADIAPAAAQVRAALD